MQLFMKIEFECAKCGQIFDQSNQSYKGIRVIGRKVVCPHCSTELLVPTQETKFQRKIGIVIAIVSLIFLGLLAYYEFVEEPKIKLYVIMIFGFAAGLGAVYSRIMDVINYRKYLKTENFQ
jgi:DNA-directed RNA polymerase subunit RPC12/RpoP